MAFAISEGKISQLYKPAGGAFSTIRLTDQIRTLLGLPDGTDSLAPNELVQAILRADVDLLYNGGIGTYIKAAEETHADL